MAFSAQVPRQAIDEDEELFQMFKNPRIRIWADSDLRIVSYWCKNQEVLNLACFVVSFYTYQH